MRDNNKSKGKIKGYPLLNMRDHYNKQIKNEDDDYLYYQSYDYN